MKILLSLLLTFYCTFTFSQNNPDVFLFDLVHAYEGLELLNMQNISNDTGYDNQPSFTDNNTILFAGNNEGQTDIATYNTNSQLRTWVNAETVGGEYSPQQIPNSTNLAAVRLDPDGKQRLYSYSPSGNPSELIENIQVAYFSFYNKSTILATVLNGSEMDLTLINLSEKSVDTLLHNAGRALQKIPNTKAMSYTMLNEEGNHDLYILEMNSVESFFVCELPIGIQDCVWINDTQIVLGSGNKLYLYDTLGEGEWNRVANLEGHGISNITRLAISPNGKQLAVVAESK